MKLASLGALALMGAIGFSTGCSPAAMKQQTLVPELTSPPAGVRSVRTMSTTTPEVVEISSRGGSMQLGLYELGELVRLDLVLHNDTDKPLRLPASFFTLADANGVEMVRLDTHDAANRTLVDEDTGPYTPKVHATARATGSDDPADDAHRSRGSIALGMAGDEGMSAIMAAEAIYATGLADETEIEPHATLHATAYWENVAKKAYPLVLGIPQLGHALHYMPGTAWHARATPGAGRHDTAPPLPSDQRTGSTSFFLYGSYNTYAMGDVNDQIDATNETIDPLALDRVTGGMGFGVDVLQRRSRHWTFGLGAERLLGRTNVSQDGSELAYNVDGWAFRALTQYALIGGRGMRVSLEGGAGMVMTTASVFASEDGVEAEIDLKGKGLMAEAGLPIEFPVSDRAAFVTRVGYRHAVVSKTEALGVELETADGDPYTIDYSGATMHVGFRVR